jgi:hypothetical protein
MSEAPTNEALLERGLSLLVSQLGPVQTLEFTAMVSRHQFDYQRWREGLFDGLSVDNLAAQAKSQGG